MDVRFSTVGSPQDVLDAVRAAAQPARPEADAVVAEKF
jgi:hypothetical protein